MVFKSDSPTILRIQEQTAICGKATNEKGKHRDLGPPQIYAMGGLLAAAKELPLEDQLKTNVTKIFTDYGNYDNEQQSKLVLSCTVGRMYEKQKKWGSREAGHARGYSQEERHAQRVAAAAARAEPEEDSGALEGFDAAWGTLLRSLTWKCVPPLDAQGVPRAAAPCQPPPRAFHAAVSLAPAGVPMLLVYGGWHPRMGNFGDIWAAKLDPWIGDPDRAQEAASARGACGVADRAAEADRRFRGELCPPGSGGPQEGSDDESDFDEHFGRMVNVNGRIIPMQLFVQIMQSSPQREGTRRIQELLSAQEEGSDEEDDENEDSDE
ncbi:unnamed protein product [Prorocentrum cordatum]|uniref:Uncharacterized protein n=1 Tax=Prorocentrum cordatum TaxID=2364126 RepID=A0ABN9S938_9DINO|nr:unnamed protein product [Polarella glacialis]